MAEQQPAVYGVRGETGITAVSTAAAAGSNPAAPVRDASNGPAPRTRTVYVSFHTSCKRPNYALSDIKFSTGIMQRIRMNAPRAIIDID